MALIFFFAILFLMTPSSNASWPPSPGYLPSSKFRSMSFYKGFRKLWGGQHQRLDQNALTIWLDRTSGSGFKSVRPFRSGYFGASIKLHPGYTAGVITSFYLSNNEAHPGFHDEVDIEFLGTTFGKPYTLQTNVYIRGSGDGRIIGREMKFHLWFDPTKDFHHYAILWSPKEIIFLVDDVPIRRYQRKVESTKLSLTKCQLQNVSDYKISQMSITKCLRFLVDDVSDFSDYKMSQIPLRPMWLYGSIWDASSWATEDGKYKADYSYQPFVARYTNFKASGCSAYAPRWCHPVSASPYRSGGLSRQQYRAMRWVQRYHMVYNYCHDHKRDHRLTPECWG